MSDTLNSPQGDGNYQALSNNCDRIRRQTPSIPRKGTETSFVGWVTPAYFCQTPSIPRKGTETLLGLDPLLPFWQ